MNLGKYNHLKEDWTIVEFFNSLKTEDKNIVKALEIIDKKQGFNDNTELWGELLFNEHYQDEFKELLKVIENTGAVADSVLEKVINTIKVKLPQEILDREINWEEEVRKYRNRNLCSRKKNYLEFLSSLVDNKLIHILYLDCGEVGLDTMLALLYPVIVEEQSELIRELRGEIDSIKHRTSLFK